MLEDKKLRRGEDGRLYFNPNDPESVDAAIREVVAVSQLHGYQKGANRINYNSGYWKGMLHGSLLVAAVVIGIVFFDSMSKKGKK